MSIKDTIEETYVVDTYKQHGKHLLSRADCSECYKRQQNWKKRVPNNERTLSDLERNQRSELDNGRL